MASDSCTNILLYYGAIAHSAQKSFFGAKLIWESVMAYNFYLNSLRYLAPQEHYVGVPELILCMSCCASSKVQKHFCKANKFRHKRHIADKPGFYQHFIFSQLSQDIQYLKEDLKDSNVKLHVNTLYFRNALAIIMRNHMKNINRLSEVADRSEVVDSYENVLNILYDTFIDYIDKIEENIDPFLMNPERALTTAAIVKRLDAEVLTSLNDEIDPYLTNPPDISTVRDHFVTLVDHFNIGSISKTIMNMMVYDRNFRQMPAATGDYLHLRSCIIDADKPSTKMVNEMVRKNIGESWVTHLPYYGALTVGIGVLYGFHFAMLATPLAGVPFAITAVSGLLVGLGYFANRNVRAIVNEYQFDVKNVGNAYRKLGSDIFFHLYLKYMMSNRIYEKFEAVDWESAGYGLADYMYRHTVYACKRTKQGVVLDTPTATFPEDWEPSGKTLSVSRDCKYVARHGCISNGGEEIGDGESGVCNYNEWSTSSQPYIYDSDHPLMQDRLELEIRKTQTNIVLDNMRAMSSSHPMTQFVLGMIRYAIADVKGSREMKLKGLGINRLYRSVESNQRRVISKLIGGQYLLDLSGHFDIQIFTIYRKLTEGRLRENINTNGSLDLRGLYRTMQANLHKYREAWPEVMPYQIPIEYKPHEPSVDTSPEPSVDTSPEPSVDIPHGPSVDTPWRRYRDTEGNYYGLNSVTGKIVYEDHAISSGEIDRQEEEPNYISRESGLDTPPGSGLDIVWERYRDLHGNFYGWNRATGEIVYENQSTSSGDWKLYLVSGEYIWKNLTTGEIHRQSGGADSPIGDDTLDTTVHDPHELEDYHESSSVQSCLDGILIRVMLRRCSKYKRTNIEAMDQVEASLRKLYYSTTTNNPVQGVDRSMQDCLKQPIQPSGDNKGLSMYLGLQPILKTYSTCKHAEADVHGAYIGNVKGVIIEPCATGGKSKRGITYRFCISGVPAIPFRYRDLAIIAKGIGDFSKHVPPNILRIGKRCERLNEWWGNLTKDDPAGAKHILYHIATRKSELFEKQLRSFCLNAMILEQILQDVLQLLGIAKEGTRPTEMHIRTLMGMDPTYLVRVLCFQLAKSSTSEEYMKCKDGILRDNIYTNTHLSTLWDSELKVRCGSADDYVESGEYYELWKKADYTNYVAGNREMVPIRAFRYSQFLEWHRVMVTKRTHHNQPQLPRFTKTKLITKKQKRERCKKLQTFFTTLFQNNGNFAQERAVFLEAFGSQ